MFKPEENLQLQFSDQFFHAEDDPIPNTNPYVKIMRELPWDKLLGKMEEFYCDDNGRPSIPVKSMLYLLIIKHRDGLSDRDLVEMIKSNMAIQKALNITFRAAQNYVHDSSFSKFRSRIGEQGIKYLEEIVNEYVKKNGGKVSKKRIVDTTVCPSNIQYPSDIQLLEKARRFLVQLIKMYGDTPLRTYTRKARKVFLSFMKFRKARKHQIKKIHGKMIRFLDRNLKQAQVVFERHLANQEESKITNKERKQIKILLTITEMLGQQKEIFKKTSKDGSKQGISIPNRIVSIFKDYVRPIPRGKIPNPTEFGAKILFEMQNGFMRIMKVAYDNIADSEMLKEFMPQFQGLDLGGDRGFHSPENTRLASEANVRNYCIQPKGKKRLPDNYLNKGMSKRRAGIEAKISLSKRKYGLRKNLYGRGPTGEEQWIRLGIAAMNLDHAIRISQKKRAA